MIWTSLWHGAFLTLIVFFQQWIYKNRVQWYWNWNFQWNFEKLYWFYVDFLNKNYRCAQLTNKIMRCGKLWRFRKPMQWNVKWHWILQECVPAANERIRFVQMQMIRLIFLQKWIYIFVFVFVFTLNFISSLIDFYSEEILMQSLHFQSSHCSIFLLMAFNTNQYLQVIFRWFQEYRRSCESNIPNVIHCFSSIFIAIHISRIAHRLFLCILKPEL